MPLDIRIQKDVGDQGAGVVTVKLTGSLDTATAPELEKQLGPVLAGSTKDIVFDLAERKALKARDGQASFVHMQAQIQEVFEIMKSLPGVAVFKSVAELDQYLAVRQRSHLQND
jgi:anti-anti-sigma regulatory factor